MNIKLNYCVAKSVTFNNVEMVELNNESLIIFQKSGNDEIFNINKINSIDLQKLVRIINVNAK